MYRLKSSIQIMIITLNHQNIKSLVDQQVEIGLKLFINWNMNHLNMKVSLSKMINKDIKDMVVKVVKEIGEVDLVHQRVKDKIVKNIEETLALLEGKLALI